VYYIRTLQNPQGNWGYWDDNTGMALMGPQNASDGTGSLNLNGKWFYEAGILPQVQNGCPNRQ
jgi:hypothetical protein